jgi:hypothetical protein
MEGPRRIEPDVQLLTDATRPSLGGGSDSSNGGHAKWCPARHTTAASTSCRLLEGALTGLSWALTTIVGTALLAAATSSAVGGGVRAASTVAGGAAQAATSGVSSYSVDSLFRSDHVDASASNQDVAAQATRILANGIRSGDVPPGDRTYLAQLVAAKAGIPQADAQKRVDDTIASTKEAETKARQAADAARKATATFAIFTARC